MNKKISIPIIILVIIISGLSIFLGFNEYNAEPVSLYQVTLNGEVIGLIESKDDLDRYIDQEQTELKEKYNTKVYAPNGLEVEKIYVYNPKVSTTKEIYEYIKDKEPFTVKGYKITIKKSDDTQLVINVLDKSQFENAVDKVIKAFVSETDYNNYINNTQAEIKTTGKKIENITILEDIKIKESLISTDELIFTDENELNKYMLFGTTEDQEKYIVKAGDTIDDISNNFKLNPAEFLVANPEYTSSSNMLYEGAEVVIGLINPQIQIAEYDHVVEDKIKDYQTEVQYDYNKPVGYQETIREGSNGKERITQKREIVNGEVTKVYPVSTETLEPSINKIIVKGKRVYTNSNIVGDSSIWTWPTNSGYYISSRYAWRWGRLHAGIDITGTGRGSPVYVVNDGVVTKVGYDKTLGKYIEVNHNNGIYTVYEHLDAQYVSVGQTVYRGQTIGAMGNTGYSTGTHLHIGFWNGPSNTSRSQSLNPCNFLKCR